MMEGVSDNDTMEDMVTFDNGHYKAIFSLSVRIVTFRTPKAYS